MGLSVDKPSLRLNQKDNRESKGSLLDTVMGVLVLAIWILGLAAGLWFLGQ